MLQPKKTKFRKFQKRKPHGIKLMSLNFGSYAIQSVSSGRLSASSIEAARRALTRKLKRDGQVWIRVFPDYGVSKKPAEVRMGKGKGAVQSWVAIIQKGQILFEVDGVSCSLALQAIKLAQQKLPLKTQFIEAV